MKHLGDDLNCRKCFEEALKRNELDVEACVNYAIFLYTKDEKRLAEKYYSDFQRILNTSVKVDKEVGIKLSQSLRVDSQLCFRIPKQ